MLERPSILLNARFVGSGPETLVLVHGFGTDQHVWDRFAPWLGMHYRVLVYDLPGMGEATGFDAQRHHRLDGHAGDLADLLDELEVQRCSFIGHSAGAMIGLLAAIADPERFDRLVLLGTSACYRNDGDYQGGFDEAQLAAMIDAIDADFRAWATDFAPVVMARPLTDPATRTFLATLRRMRPDIALTIWRAIVLADYRNTVGSCRVPTALLQVRTDPAVPLSAARFLNEKIAGSAIEVLDVDGHLPHLSSPVVVAQALRRHLPRFDAAA